MGASAWIAPAQPLEVNALSLEAQSRLEDGNLAGAEELYLRLSRMTGDAELQGVDGLFTIYARKRRHEEGMRIFREHYNKTHDPMFLVRGASRMADSGREEQALKELAPVIERLKKGEKLGPRVTGSMAFTLRYLGDLENALLAARDAEEGFRATRSIQWINMGDLVASLLEDMNRTLEALSEYEFIIQEAPDNPWILNNYSYYLAVHGKELARAEAMAKRSLVLDPNNGHTLDTLGFIQLKLGKVEDSINAMVHSWRLNPDEMVVRTHLAQSLAKRKDKSERMQELLDVLRTEPDEENTKKIQQLLLAIGE